jgi:SOS response associated peptidase (SRAP)
LVILRNHKTSEVSLDALRWGLIPYWCEDPKGGQKPINAKCETVHSLPTFRDAYRRRRCILPVDGFFEWKAIKGQKAKQPYAIAMKDRTAACALSDAVSLSSRALAVLGHAELYEPIRNFSHCGAPSATVVWATISDRRSDVNRPLRLGFCPLSRFKASEMNQRERYRLQWVGGCP